MFYVRARLASFADFLFICPSFSFRSEDFLSSKFFHFRLVLVVFRDSTRCVPLPSVVFRLCVKTPPFFLPQYPRDTYTRAGKTFFILVEKTKQNGNLAYFFLCIVQPPGNRVKSMTCLVDVSGGGWSRAPGGRFAQCQLLSPELVLVPQFPFEKRAHLAPSSFTIFLCD